MKAFVLSLFALLAPIAGLAFPMPGAKSGFSVDQTGLVSQLDEVNLYHSLGLRNGDRIVKIAGKEVGKNRDDAFYLSLREGLSNGDAVILREGKEHTFRITKKP